MQLYSLSLWEYPKGKPLPVSLRATTLPKGEGIAFPSGEGGTAIAVTEEAVFLKEGGKGPQQFCNCPTNWIQKVYKRSLRCDHPHRRGFYYLTFLNITAVRLGRYILKPTLPFSCFWAV